MGEMKDSGNRWIGNIPLDWNVKKIKYLATLKGRIGWQGLTSDEYQEEGAYLITGVDFQNGKVNWESCEHVPMKRWEEAKEIQIQNGDLLITKDGTVGKVAIVLDMPAETSLNSGVLRIVTREGFSTKFLFWVLQSSVFWNWFNFKNAGNSTIIHLYQGDFAEFMYAYPCEREQQAIASFLDQQCEKIDGIIADIEHQIDVLRKYKKSLITETVTKGLDQSVPMKDSGVKWIGEIPEHWTIRKVKYTASFHNGDRSERYPSGGDIVDEGIAFINSESIHELILDESSKYITTDKYKSLGGAKIRINDIIFCLRGSVGNCSINKMYDEGTVASSLVAIRSQKVNPDFLNYFFHSGIAYLQTDVLQNGSCAANLSAENVGSYIYVSPLEDEQKRIVVFLNVKITEINNVLASKQTQLEKMQSYRKSLIYEYVTGKKRITM